MNLHVKMNLLHVYQSYRSHMRRTELHYIMFPVATLSHEKIYEALIATGSTIECNVVWTYFLTLPWCHIDKWKRTDTIL